MSLGNLGQESQFSALVTFQWNQIDVQRHIVDHLFCLFMLHALWIENSLDTDQTSKLKLTYSFFSKETRENQAKISWLAFIGFLIQESLSPNACILFKLCNIHQRRSSLGYLLFSISLSLSDFPMDASHSLSGTHVLVPGSADTRVVIHWLLGLPFPALAFAELKLKPGVPQTKGHWTKDDMPQLALANTRPDSSWGPSLQGSASLWPSVGYKKSLIDSIAPCTIQTCCTWKQHWHCAVA